MADNATRKVTGSVVYLYAFDLAYDMRREPLRKLLGRDVEQYCIEPVKRMPRYMFFYCSQMAKLEPQILKTGAGEVKAQIHLQVFSIGALSIQVRLPFAIDNMAELVGYHDLQLEAQSLEEYVLQLAEEARKELLDYCIRPAETMQRQEAYTVFCMDELPRGAGVEQVSAEDWLNENRRSVAGLLTDERDSDALSRQEAWESTGLYLSYYDSELVVVDWDAALVVGETAQLDDILQVAELANVQLVELGAYDRLLDSSLQMAYRDLRQWKLNLRREVRRNLREMRIDLARLRDELGNISKFFGDWHLARVYQNFSARFHLNDSYRMLDAKLATLDDLYHILQQDRTNLLMIWLETAIVLLFIIDVVLLLLGL